MSVKTAPDSLSKRLSENLARIKKDLGFEVNFDVIIRHLRIAEREAVMIGIDGFIKDEVLLRVIERLLPLDRRSFDAELEQIFYHVVGHIEATRSDDIENIKLQVLSGQIALLVDGAEQAIMIDTRTYPAREPSEPDMEKILRGPKDGFTETLVMNTALVRRRLRAQKLRIEMNQVGDEAPTDVAMLWMEDRANPKLVSKIRKQLTEIKVDAIPMAEKTIEELLTGPYKWWNPFPVTRFTERPDVVAIHLLEGHVVLIIDTSPVALILPSTFFHHMQHPEEYHEDTSVAFFLRIFRFVALIIAWPLIPLWVVAAMNPDILPKWLEFIGPKDIGPIPLFLQFILAEVGIEMIRLSLIHTPTALATSLGLIGAVLLGQLAVEVGLFANETVLYVTLAALGAFTIPSTELSSAVRLMRLILLLFVGIGGITGFVIGLLLQLILLVSTRSYGRPYLWPLAPWNTHALSRMLTRQPAPFMHRFSRTGWPSPKRRRRIR